MCGVGHVFVGNGACAKNKQAGVKRKEEGTDPLWKGLQARFFVLHLPVFMVATFGKLQTEKNSIFGGGGKGKSVFFSF